MPPFVVFVAFVAACRCGGDEGAGTDAGAATGWRLELLDDHSGHRGAALAFGAGGMVAAGDDDAVEVWVGERLLGRVDLPGYRRGALAIRDDQLLAWPHRVPIADGQIGAPQPLEAPMGRAIPVRDGWLTLRGDATATRATLAWLDATGAPTETLGEVAADAVLATRDSLVAVGTTDVELRGGGRDRRLGGTRYALRALAFANDRLLGLEASGALLAWDLETGEMAPLVAHMGDARALAVGGASDRFVATGGTDGRVAVWLVASLPRRAGQSVEPLAEITFPGMVEAIAWHPSRAELVVGLREPRRDRLVRLGLRER
ncbi:MAG: hypothetical protein KF901_07865 [Myxococcales bacterium]|nr:hypothetical protein [Myxococcales bacterium]